MYDALRSLECVAEILEKQYVLHDKVNDFIGKTKVSQDLEEIATQYLEIVSQV